MKKTSESWLSIGVLAVVTLLTYGVLIPWLGFYRDDWYLLWAAQSGGPNAVIALFQSDRPLIGYLFAGFYALLGDAPLGWHLLALLFRLTANLSVLWLARQMFSGRGREALIVALLFAVYPGFVSQPNAGVFVIHLLAMAVAVLSFALTAAAIRTPRPGTAAACTALSLALAALYLGSLEYMIGLEAARPALVAYVLWRKDPSGQRPGLGRILRFSVPYLVVAAAFAYWRLFIFQSTRHATNLTFLVGDYAALPLRSLAAALIETLKDGVETTFFAWIVPFYRFTATAGYRDLAYAVLIAGGVVLVAGAHLRAISRKEPTPAAVEPRQSALAILVGAWFVIAALLPINAAGRNVIFDEQWDRYALPAALGVALVVGGLLAHHLQRRAREVMVLLLIASSVVVHYFSASSYRDLWSSTRDLWWQVIWRAPAIERGTMLFVPASEFAEGYEIYGPANLIYYPGEASLQVGAEVLNTETAAYLQSGQSLEHFDRSTRVPDNYDQALIALVPRAGSCLHVLDGRLVELPGFVDESLVASVAEWSQIDRIGLDTPASARPAFLGGEPVHGWCYRYQEIQLARQRQDWAEVARLFDNAESQGLRPNDPSEWLAAVEAYVASGRQQDARHAASIVRADLPTRFFLCAELSRESPFGAPYDPDTVRSLICRGGS